jgi:hypothetical protein
MGTKGDVYLFSTRWTPTEFPVVQPGRFAAMVFPKIWDIAGRVSETWETLSDPRVRPGMMQPE